MSTVVLISREQSSMASCWTEYLCLERLDDGKYRLFSGMYEALAEREQFLNEETEDYDLPDEINGKKVVKIDDDFVVGGDLGWCNPEEKVDFENVEDVPVGQWLHETKWASEIKLDAIRAAVMLLD